MKIMKNFMTRKIVLVVGVVGSMLGGIVGYQEYLGFCTLIDGAYYRNCFFGKYITNEIAGPLFIVSLSLLIISVPLFFVRDQVFRSWLKFAYWWMPLFFVFMFFAPMNDSSLLPIDKSRVAFIVFPLFLLISLAIIIIKSIKSRGK